jgi:hypothetical protein
MELYHFRTIHTGDLIGDERGPSGVPWVPTQMVLASAGTPALPISILLPPVRLELFIVTSARTDKMLPFPFFSMGL